MIQKGDTVRLVTMPTGYTKSFYEDLTVGNTYQVLDLEGSNVWTTCDKPGEKRSYWRGCVEKVS